MEIYSTEEQQVEAIRKWWKENKWSVIGGVIIGIAVLAGGRAWVEGQHSYMESAYSDYQKMVQNISSGKIDEAEKLGASVLGQYSDTPYASLAALALANLKLSKGDLVAAESHLHWALDNTKQESVKHETRLRLARVFLADNKPDEAMKLLNITDTGDYSAAYEQLKGDIFVKLKKYDSARTSYSRALQESSPASPDRRSLQMKLDDLGSPPEMESKSTGS